MVVESELEAAIYMALRLPVPTSAPWRHASLVWNPWVAWGRVCVGVAHE